METAGGAMVDATAAAAAAGVSVSLEPVQWHGGVSV